MANKKSKAEMRKVYMRRRIIALIVLLLIILLIISRCTKPKTNTTTTTTKQTVETTQNQPVEMQKVPSNEVNVTPAEASPQTTETTKNTNTLNNTNTNTAESTEMTENEKALSTMENELNRYYSEVADVEYKDYNNAFFFDLKGDAKDLYLKKDATENDEKAFKTFWNDFKKDLVKSSQEITENIEPRIELHVVSPVDNKSTAVMIKDGEEIFDITER